MQQIPKPLFLQFKSVYSLWIFASKIYKKRDDFNVDIVNFRFGWWLSSPIRFARVYNHGTEPNA